ncbi:DNA-3-methyladenine glycosylase [Melioribacter roseus P3M-2]|uniref:DNA-3-methyladenine glycosylase II n=1 Tax=Melioribacter roseus (strain DSM 23840 / JCM 17771 / VKM B-2668 / P3M-2) TaxID=1191523 RepID=I6YTY6_MELRP|nr:DNA-3-methyladenine glycosylase [Melioribacter roseus]AFN73982.1 DNA-3-methyladenine glycosylase [Melioribacter roseus P3M-2]
MKIIEIERALAHLSRNDKVLSTLIKNNGICNLPTHKKYFIALLRAIIGQQLSLKAADSINRKFLAYFDNSPDPDSILSAKDETLRSLGLSKAKVKYVKDLALKVKEGEVKLKNFSKKRDEEIIEELTKVKGVGVWTAQMFLIFTLGRPDVLPVDDLGIRKAIMLNYGLKNLPSGEEIKRLAKKNGWSPFSTIASLYLWKSLDTNFETILK